MKKFNYRGKFNKNYFEGWYIRLTGKENIAVIMGLSKSNDPHAFIQFTDTKKVIYKRYSLDQVSFSEGVKIGDSKLTNNKLILNIDDISIEANFKNVKELDKKSIMGMLYYLPLECYQEIVYLDGEYEDGTIYMEKTYGRKFPKEWIWIQSNTYPLSFAAAKMPLLLNKYGFYCVFEHNGKQIILSSYKFGRIKINDSITMKQGKYKLIIKLHHINPVKLVGPVNGGLMKRDVWESLESEIEVELYIKGKLVDKSLHKNIGAEYEIK